ncbi:MAG: hypothetical protein A3E78_14090 [Alphaproteobacteria bacterium RIFCSPHIGHO2_12_FULL_63_12]|nr:MAG: hypothetical protein A3E78_14090 [Alphaproteobacteria bacterium RIFCSPHIGHO2_12_FULL_63_12]
MMKKSIGLIAAASALALLSAPAMAEKGGSKPDKPHGASNADGHRQNGEKSDRGDKDHDNNSECGLGRREHGDDPAGARDPDLERDGDCPASDDHGDRHEDHGDDHGDDADDHGDHRENADRGRGDEHRGDGADDDADGDDRADGADTAKKKRSWRWPWERDN